MKTKKKQSTKNTKAAKKEAPKKSAGVRTDANERKEAGAPAVELKFTETTLPATAIAVVYNARSEEEFSPEEMAELRDSIERHGIQNRLWVYPLEKLGKHGETHGLIAGERRWRAHQLTSRALQPVPVKIYDVGEKLADEIGLMDNIQRKQLSAVDEAFGMLRMVTKHGLKWWDEADPGSSVGHRLGKSKTATFAARKLTELPKLGITALRKGELSPSVGVRIARIPNEKMQKEALTRAIEQEWTDSDAADYIAHDYMTELKGAPFDRKDETLNKQRGSCEKCPYRSGNQAEMYPDMAAGRGDICTDPGCFRGKCVTAFDRRAAEHVEKGGKVLTPKEAKEAGLYEHYSSIGGGYTELDSQAYDIGEYGKTWRQLLAPALKDGSLLPILALANDGSGKHYELLQRTVAIDTAKTLGLVKKEVRGGGGGSNEMREHKLRAQRAQARVIHWLKAMGERAPESDVSAVGLVEGMCKWVMARMHVDAKRRVALSMDLERKNFQLDKNNGPHAWIDTALLLAFEQCVNLPQYLAFLSRLLAAPEYIGGDGGLDERAQIVAEMLELDPKALEREARAAVAKAEAAKALGKLWVPLGDYMKPGQMYSSKELFGVCTGARQGDVYSLLEKAQELGVVVFERDYWSLADAPPADEETEEPEQAELEEALI